MGAGRASLRYSSFFFFEYFKMNHGVIEKTAGLNLHFSPCSLAMHWLYFLGVREALKFTNLGTVKCQRFLPPPKTVTSPTLA